ncbi:MAG: transcription-repair coupling factor [Pseudomonadota bacterium]
MTTDSTATSAVSRTLLPLLSPASASQVGGLVGASTALALAELAASEPRPVVYFAESQQMADQLEAAARFFAPADLPVLHFPDWETLAYDSFSPHQDIISQRLSVLSELRQIKRGLLVVAAQCALHRLPPLDYVAARSLDLREGQTLDTDAFTNQLVATGYARVPQVTEHGEFALRGAILDVFPMGAEAPIRIDLFDDEIETLRFFDPDTQLSGDKTPAVILLPGREVPLDQPSVKGFRQRYRERFPERTQAQVYKDISAGLAYGGIEYYLPLFFETTSNLLDYLPAQARITTNIETTAAISAAFEQAVERYEVLSVSDGRPLLRPEEAFFTPDELRQRLRDHDKISLSREKPIDGVDVGTKPLPPIALNANVEDASRAFVDFINNRSAAGRVLLVAETAGRRESLIDLCKDLGLKPVTLPDWQSFEQGTHELAITVGDINEGMTLPAEPPITLITEQALYGQRVRTRRRKRRGQRDPEAVIRQLSDLTVGAPVIHEAYGVGRYLGLQTLTVGDITNEFLTLEYAGGDKLYVPVHALSLISRYTGASPDKAPLHRLGTDQWQKARRRAAEKARDVAAELLDVYARRAARKGVSMHTPQTEYRQFGAEFPFELTDDQAASVEAILADMQAGTPMDRVVCGDVGFGKTEVALRAAFVCAQNGRQVAVLVPTTLLAQQHYQTFVDRFADWPVQVELLSRFRSKKAVDATLAGMAAGTVDIVIGTHKLLGHTQAFKSPGLVIIDEEHRFGVRHKEALKSLRSEIDVLTLTATPIPRTLNMALGGLRELSLITTPPADRLSVKTFISRWNEGLIREACLREIRRGGQVYFVHNRVEDIEKVASDLKKLVPEATVGIGHGQMSERELEQVMFDFYHRNFNVFVCTTIVESGIDVPTANTIIINRADRFGLAQLHQLRGRVGRSHHRAYAYLITPPKNAMTADAVKRLEAIESLEDLGAGFALASHDLEIRGAGELLGEGQSGQIQEIGFSMYTELLTTAVKALREGKEPAFDQPLNAGVEINLHRPALLPEDYVPDVHLRLMLYKRIASCKDEAQLRELQIELIDRFGLLPEATRLLMDITRLKQRAESLDIVKIDANQHSGFIKFSANPNIDPIQIITLVQREPERYKLQGADKLTFRASMPDGEDRVKLLQGLLDRLSSTANTAVN